VLQGTCDKALPPNTRQKVGKKACMWLLARFRCPQCKLCRQCTVIWASCTVGWAVCRRTPWATRLPGVSCPLLSSAAE
jgi:hypothetical protein